MDAPESAPPPLPANPPPPGPPTLVPGFEVLRVPQLVMVVRLIGCLMLHLCSFDVLNCVDMLMMFWSRRHFDDFGVSVDVPIQEYAGMDTEKTRTKTFRRPAVVPTMKPCSMRQHIYIHAWLNACQTCAVFPHAWCLNHFESLHFC